MDGWCGAEIPGDAVTEMTSEATPFLSWSHLVLASERPVSTTLLNASFQASLLLRRGVLKKLSSLDSEPKCSGQT